MVTGRLWTARSASATAPYRAKGADGEPAAVGPDTRALRTRRVPVLSRAADRDRDVRVVPPGPQDAPGGDLRRGRPRGGGGGRRTPGRSAVAVQGGSRGAARGVAAGTRRPTGRLARGPPGVPGRWGPRVPWSPACRRGTAPSRPWRRCWRRCRRGCRPGSWPRRNPSSSSGAGTGGRRHFAAAWPWAAGPCCCSTTRGRRARPCKPPLQPCTGPGPGASSRSPSGCTRLPGTPVDPPT
jgi:hypothetical protein